MSVTEASTIAHCRVDTVGSLLRPPELLQAYTDADAGDLDERGLAKAQNRAIREVVAEQEAHGMPVVTDGEFRRRWFSEGFGDVAGFAHGELSPILLPEHFSMRPASDEVEQKVIMNPASRFATTERLRLVFNRPLEEFVHARALTERTVKVSFANPNRVVALFDAEASTDVYPDVEAFRADVIAIQREMIAQLVRAGCEYIQVDAPGYAAYIDERNVAAMKERGEDPTARLEQAIATDNAIIDGFDDVTFGLHVCRGNFRGQPAREGGYDEVGERLYNGLRHQRLLLEYDSPRAGSFDSLRFVPEGKVAVLGLISTKSPELESVDELKRRIEEASRFLGYEQLALSCQCGFGSMMEGHPLTPGEQWAKLDRMLEVADAVWS